MKAVVIKGTDAQFVKDRSLPKLRPDYVLVKPYAVALNPTDWKHVSFQRAKDGALIGCDYAGVVEEVGSSVTKTWRKGDRICGCVHGSNLVNEEDGAFAEYIVAKGDLQMKVPMELDFEKAATVSLGAITVGQGLYQKSLKLNLPTDPIRTQEYVLIYGGGTATGGLAIQYANLSGYSVIAICGQQDFERLRELGAVFCVDYKDPDAGNTVRRYTDNTLRYAWDTIATEASAEICANALSTYPGNIYGTTNPIKSPRADVHSSAIVMYTMFGEAFQFGSQVFPASAEDFEFAKMFMSLTEDLLREVHSIRLNLGSQLTILQGKLKTHKEIVRDGGLAAIPYGLNDLKAGKVSSGKLVYRIMESP